MDDMIKTRKAAERVKHAISLSTYLVGVKFYHDTQNTISHARKLQGYRYCQALMAARNGEHVILDGEGIACPAAAAAFGFKPLPEALKSGRRLKSFGIVQDEETGKRMFEGMTTLAPGTLVSLYLFPLEQATEAPDIVVVEGEIEKLMWFALARLNMEGGRRVESSTAMLQATCVDATLIPYVTDQFNMSFGCYGCRNATDMEPNETVIGFPFSQFEGIAQTIEFLSEKAVPQSRNKKALIQLQQKSARLRQEGC